MAYNGEKAVELARERAYDLILLDVLMPGLDGYETCRAIRQTELNGETPVVFVTGHDDQAARQEAASAGGSGFVPKPVLASQLKLVALTHTVGQAAKQMAVA
jgi:putative two-component system response regulator